MYKHCDTTQCVADYTGPVEVQRKEVLSSPTCVKNIKR